MRLTRTPSRRSPTAGTACGGRSRRSQACRDEVHPAVLGVLHVQDRVHRRRIRERGPVAGGTLEREGMDAAEHPAPPGADRARDVSLRVSCVSARSCVAVGDSNSGRPFSHKYDTYRSLAENWNGRRWAIDPTPRPPAPSKRSSRPCPACRRATARAWGTRHSTDLNSFCWGSRGTGSGGRSTACPWTPNRPFRTSVGSRARRHRPASRSAMGRLGTPSAGTVASSANKRPRPDGGSFRSRRAACSLAAVPSLTHREVSSRL